MDMSGREKGMELLLRYMVGPGPVDGGGGFDGPRPYLYNANNLKIPRKTGIYLVPHIQPYMLTLQKQS
jgi:hypothetical protein